MSCNHTSTHQLSVHLQKLVVRSLHHQKAIPLASLRMILAHQTANDTIPHQQMAILLYDQHVQELLFVRLAK